VIKYVLFALANMVPAATPTPDPEILFFAVAITKYGTEFTADGIY